MQLPGDSAKRERTALGERATPSVADPALDPRAAEFAAWHEARDREARDNAAVFLEGLASLRRETAAGTKGLPMDVAAAWQAGLAELAGVALLRNRDPAGAREALLRALAGSERALALAALPGMARTARRRFAACQTRLGEIEFQREAWGEALRWFCRSRDIHSVSGDSRSLGAVLGHIAEVYAVAGLWALELELALEARRVAERAGDEETIGRVEINLARAYRRLRDFPEARRRAEAAIIAFGQLANRREELRARIELSMLDLEEGRPAEALERLRADEALSAQVGDPGLELTRLAETGRASLALGRAMEARQVLQVAIELREGMRGHDAPVATAGLRLVLARALAADAHWHEGEAQARAVLDELMALGRPSPLEAEAHAVLADAARGVQAWQRACEEEVAKTRAFERHHHHQAALRVRVLAVRHEIDLARATASREREERIRLQQALAEVRARLTHAGPASGARTIDDIAAPELQALGLTAREAEVLLWTARGKTNDEIASILDRSLSTVKKHLEGSFRKLGVENRLAAATVVLQFVARQNAPGAPADRLAAAS